MLDLLSLVAIGGLFIGIIGFLGNLENKKNPNQKWMLLLVALLSLLVIISVEDYEEKQSINGPDKNEHENVNVSPVIPFKGWLHEYEYVCTVDGYSGLRVMPVFMCEIVIRKKNGSYYAFPKNSSEPYTIKSANSYDVPGNWYIWWGNAPVYFEFQP